MNSQTTQAKLPAWQDIVRLIEDGDTAEARKNIIELQEAAQALQRENLALNLQLEGRAPAAAAEPALVFEKGAYWKQAGDSANGGPVGPFCQACYDREQKLVHLQQHLSIDGGWYCAVCRHYF